MTNEDAIKWLENLKQDIGQLRHEDLWPYAQAIDEICGLLKEQEPRVLTWDEVERAEVCWMEQRGYEPYADLDAADWNPKCYGNEIRCWSAKPTKEQMKAVKWDD